MPFTQLTLKQTQTAQATVVAHPPEVVPEVLNVVVVPRRNTVAAAQGPKVRMADGTLETLEGIARHPYREPEGRHDLGLMNIECSDCQALHWEDEKLANSTAKSVSLLWLHPPPTLHTLLTTNTLRAREFRENIWRYNRAFAFTSLHVREDHSVNNRGPPVFRILGELYHRGGPLEASRHEHPAYARLYIYDAQAALNQDLDATTLQELQAMILNVNTYAQLYRHAYEILDEGRVDGAEDPVVHLRSVPVVQEEVIHPCRGSLPTADEVAVIICDTGGENPIIRDLVIHLRGGGLCFINDLHPAYTPLYYVLLFPHGER